MLYIYIWNKIKNIFPFVFSLLPISEIFYNGIPYKLQVTKYAMNNYFCIKFDDLDGQLIIKLTVNKSLNKLINLWTN